MILGGDIGKSAESNKISKAATKRGEGEDEEKEKEKKRRGRQARRKTVRGS